MKKIIFYSITFLSLALTWSACKKSNYPGGVIGDYVPLYDLRNLYKGSDVTLTNENMFGSSSITGVVISDHSGKNLPEGLLIIQDKRRLGLIRGISIPIGADAAKYVPGDSVGIKVEGAILKRVNGILQVTGISSSAITKIASNVPIPPNRVGSSFILAKPNDYESTLVAIVKAGFEPGAGPNDTYAGDKTINDGFDNFTLHTEATATFANTGGLNFNGNYYGIIFNTIGANGVLKPHQRMRTIKDAVALSSTPDIASAIITGYMADAEGGDGNYEYMQFMATRDIDFEVTPFCVVVTNNAGASSPTGVFPTKGWATGADALKTPVGLVARTYKFNLTSGKVSKGEFFYVGGSSKLINGSKSKSIASSKWIRSKDYTVATPANAPAGNGDGFGLYTTGLFANSGNASGFAIFEGTTVDVNTAPIDVIFVGGGGSLYNAPSVGYKVANTDFYDKINPITLASQPYYRSGENTLCFNYQLPADQGFWNKLGGIYNPSLGKWIKARSQSDINLSTSSTIEDIEGTSLVRILNAVTGEYIRTDTIPPTRLK
ncbi:DUF5689 domain-containing protein [Pedobacter roseus]|uniref:DUF5689 domain-containing protein n=1 Tax=Pedobacter roseus TaxID=336820 RepID=A0A7G9QLA9_9SPHI|nr:DUF5689 domain-containing protein [Pedobacter roseus]QNN44134.1 hypothetical protein H9L23_08690 [Pedobacter roseus]